MLNSTISAITERLIQRSLKSRTDYLNKMGEMRSPTIHDLEPSNAAHILAGLDESRRTIVRNPQAHSLGIISSYNEMVSAHVPYADYPDKIKHISMLNGHAASMIGGVPAVCDGVVQGYQGMELSLLSRDVIAMATAIPISCSNADRIVLLGTCDKIVPGMLIGALSRGYLPSAFIPSGPMSSGVSNKEKSAARQAFHCNSITKDELLDIECKCYHGSGTCTFYGTANTNQVMLEALGLQPIGSGLSPHQEANHTIEKMVPELVKDDIPALAEVITEKSLINACVVWLATGGSTNHTLHLVAIARAAGIQLQWDDLSDLSEVVPLLAKIYPNGDGDVNDFHHSGGVATVMIELMKGGLLHLNTLNYCGETLNETLLGINAKLPDYTNVASVEKPFSAQGGIKVLKGNLGQGVMKVSAVSDKRKTVIAPARVFTDQQSVYEAYQKDELWKDGVIVVKQQGVRANGMPELHKLIPLLSNIYDKGYNVALVTDGRLSGASGKVPAVVHVTPEAYRGGEIDAIKDGDIIEVDGHKGILTTHSEAKRSHSQDKLDLDQYNDIFEQLRQQALHPSLGAMTCL